MLSKAVLFVIASHGYDLIEYNPIQTLLEDKGIIITTTSPQGSPDPLAYDGILLFYGKEIITPWSNPNLNTLLQKAKAQGVPIETITIGKPISLENFVQKINTYHPIRLSCLAWDTFLKEQKGYDLMTRAYPEPCGCGLVYALPNYLQRDGESFAIADMRNIKYSEPHYHSAGVTEIYFIMQGKGLVVVGEQEYQVTKGDIIVTPPLTTHYVIPDNELILAVVNIPAFKIEDYHIVTETNGSVRFDKNRFDVCIQQNEKNSVCANLFMGNRVECQKKLNNYKIPVCKETN